MGCCADVGKANDSLREPKLGPKVSSKTAASLRTTDVSLPRSSAELSKTDSQFAAKEIPACSKNPEVKIHEKLVPVRTQGLQLNSIVFEMDLDEDELD